MSFKPLGNYVLIKVVEVPNTTKSGLALPESAIDKPNQGKIIAVGDGIRADNGDLIPLRVSIDDTVLFPKYSGVEIKLEEGKFLLIREQELLGIIA